MEHNHTDGSAKTSHTEAEQRFNKRLNRMQRTVALEKPDKVPIVLPAGYLLAELGGISKQEFLENPEKAQIHKEKVALDFQPDAIAGAFPPDPRPYLVLGDRMSKFPGHGLGSNSEYQFVENEFMMAEDYLRSHSSGKGCRPTDSCPNCPRAKPLVGFKAAISSR